jgi:hypothetical protein
MAPGLDYSARDTTIRGEFVTGHPLFLQNVIAVIWDFDKTLIPEYMQGPLFRHFGVDPGTFWAEVGRLPDLYRRQGIAHVSSDTIYLNHLLAYVRQGRFRDLNNQQLRDFGGDLSFFPGLPDFFGHLRDVVRTHAEFAAHAIQVEHYVVSSGLRPTILGSAIAAHVDEVWACELAEGEVPGHSRPVLSEIAYAIDNTTKTRAIFEINKGSNVIREIDVNAAMAPEDRRVPFRNMIYVADGPSDIPVFSLLHQYGGRTAAVYKAGSEAAFHQAKALHQQKRVDFFAEADYRPGTSLSLWLRDAVSDIAAGIVADRLRRLSERVGAPPRHLAD